MKLMKVGVLLESKRLFLKAVRKLLVPDGINMERELEKKGKPAELILLDILRDTRDKIDGKHQREAFYDTALFLLFVYHKDNAHHHQGNYLLYRLMERKDEFMKGLEWERRGDDYLDPKTWRINMWVEHDKKQKR